MLANVSEARNTALKAEMMIQDKRTDFAGRNRFQPAPMNSEKNISTNNLQSQ